jgi:hypothetical protein
MGPKPIARSRPKQWQCVKKKASGRPGTSYSELAERRVAEVARVVQRAEVAEQRADIAEQRAETAEQCVADAEHRADVAHAHLLETQLLLVEAERRLTWTRRWPCRTCWMARLAEEEDDDNRDMFVEAAEADLESSS